MPKTYSLLTKNRTVAVVPRDGNHMKAVAQATGYYPGLVAGLVSAMIFEPIWNSVKDTHIGRGLEHGFVDAHHKIDMARATVAFARSNSPDELREQAVKQNLVTQDQATSMTDTALARMLALESVGTPFPPASPRDMNEFLPIQSSAEMPAGHLIV